MYPTQGQQNESKDKKWRSNPGTHLWERMSTSPVSRPAFQLRGWSAMYLFILLASRRGGANEAWRNFSPAQGLPATVESEPRTCVAWGPCHCLGLPHIRNEHPGNVKPTCSKWQEISNSFKIEQMGGIKPNKNFKKIKSKTKHQDRPNGLCKNSEVISYPWGWLLAKNQKPKNSK